MKGRYILLSEYFYEDNLIWFNDLWINPFQIESFTETDIEYNTPEGEHVNTTGVKINTRSGREHDLNMTLDEFTKAIA